MIQLTRLNKHPISVNSDLIKFVERAPDTVITLVTGEKIVVGETADEVCQRIVEFRRSLLRGLPPVWDGSHPGLAFPEHPPERSTKHEL